MKSALFGTAYYVRHAYDGARCHRLRVLGGKGVQLEGQLIAARKTVTMVLATVAFTGYPPTNVGCSELPGGSDSSAGRHMQQLDGWVMHRGRFAGLRSVLSLLDSTTIDRVPFLRAAQLLLAPREGAL